MHLSPAAYVIHVFRGVRATARVLGRAPSSISKWTKPKDDRGTGGNIPSRAIREILAKAKEMKLDITPEDLLFGRDIDAHGGSRR